MDNLRIFAMLLLGFAPASAQVWSLNYSTATTTEQIVVLSAPADDICWFVTNFDNLYKTADAGATWTIVPPTATSFNPSGLFVMNSSVAFKSSSQFLFRTTDGGLSWTLVHSGSAFSPPVIRMKDDLNGVMASGGMLYGTANGGISWSTAGLAQPPFNIQNTSGKGSIYNLGDELWVTQQSGGIAHSSNFGLAWTTPGNSGLSSTAVDARISFADANFGIATRGSVWPYVYVTTDGGNSWTNADDSQGANQDVVADGSDLWYIPNPADHFYVKHSADGGASWQVQLQLSDGSGFSVLEKARSGHRLWAGTTKGKVYTYLPLLSIRPDEQPKTTLYPNPVSGMLNISGPGLRHITVYDLYGKKMFSLELNDAQQASIDVSALEDGLYLASLSSSEGHRTTKFAVCHR